MFVQGLWLRGTGFREFLPKRLLRILPDCINRFIRVVTEWFTGLRHGFMTGAEQFYMFLYGVLLARGSERFRSLIEFTRFLGN